MKYKIKKYSTGDSVVKRLRLNVKGYYLKINALFI